MTLFILIVEGIVHVGNKILLVRKRFGVPHLFYKENGISQAVISSEVERNLTMLLSKRLKRKRF